MGNVPTGSRFESWEVVEPLGGGTWLLHLSNQNLMFSTIMLHCPLRILPEEEGGRKEETATDSKPASLPSTITELYITCNYIAYFIITFN